MNACLSGQMDFVYFVYGLAFFLLAVVAWSLRRQRAGSLAWGWLLAFGCIHGVNVWLGVVLGGMAFVPALHALRLMLQVVAFVCLLEFGRASLVAVRRPVPGPWLHVPLLLAVAVVAQAGQPVLQAVVFYLIAFPACVLTAWALMRLDQTLQPNSRRLYPAILAMAFYAVMAGLLPAPAPWWPATFLNEDQFLLLFHCPPQVVCGLLIGVLAINLQSYGRYQHKPALQPLEGRCRAGWLAWPVVLLLGLGWGVTNHTGHLAEQELRNDMLLRVQLLAAATDVAQVRTLNGTPANVGNPAYQALKRQYIAMRRVNDQCGACYLAGSRAGGVFLFLDSEMPPLKFVPEDSLADSRAALQGVFLTGHPTVDGPRWAPWGYGVSAFAPILDVAGHVLAVAGMDVKADDWAQIIANGRLWPILIQMLIMLILIGLYVILQRWQDLSDRLASSERQYRSLFEDDALPMILMDPETGTIVDVNPAAASFYGYTRKGMSGLAVSAISQFTPEQHRQLHQEALQGPLTYRSRHRLAGGQVHDVEVALSPLMMQGQRRFFAIVRDVTTQVRAAAALQLSEQRFRSLYENMASMVTIQELVFDSTSGALVDYRILDCNPAFEKITGIPKQRAQGALASQLYSPDLPPYLEIYAQVAATGQPMQFNTFYSSLDKYFAVSVFTLGPNQLATIARDITALKLDEEQLLLQSAALSATADGIVITAPDGRIIWCNPAFAVITGYETREVLGQNPRILKSGHHEQAFYADLWKTITSGHVWRGEIINRRKDGTLYTEKMSITPVRNSAGVIAHFVAIKEDVTEQRALQQQFLQSQKMESIGRLSAGIAHDFNNQLQGILGFSDLLRRTMAEDDPRRADVEEIRKAAHQAANLTRQLMTFGRRQPLEMQVLDLNKQIQDAHKLHQRLVGEDVVFDLRLAPELDRVKADAGQMEQVLMNLLVNARDAMPQGGRITISTLNVTLDGRDTSPWNDVRPGRFVVLAVSDTGVGIAPENVARIFEPFFSTKEKGRGTGLGLATVYSIARQHAGWVHVYSQLGGGSTFKVYIPALVSMEEPVVLPAPSESEANSYGAGQRILLVEDEDGVRELAARVLRENNYAVTAAATVTGALQLFEAAAQPFELVLSDVVLPDGNGLELVEQLLARQPGLRVVMASGYTDERSRWPAIRERGLRFIPKPYPVATLLRVVHETITAPAAS